MHSLFNLPQGPYFLSHSVGCLPIEAEQSLAENYLATWKESGGDAWPAWMQVISDFQQELANLLGGQASEFCPQVNLSAGLTKLLTAMTPEPGRNKVLMHASAFPSMGFVVQALEEYGYELKLIDGNQDVRDLDVWSDAMSEDVAVSFITHVHSNSGILSPVAEICALGRMRGVISILDVAQSAGIVPMDINYWHVDVVLGSCVKWLCGGPGAGYMWVNSNLIESMKPKDVGWFSHQNPFEFDINHFEYAENTQRFMGGTPSVAPYALALGSLRMINRLGVDTIRAHNQKLKKIVLQVAKGKAQNLIEPDKSGGTLCLSFSETEADKLAQSLSQHGAFFDRRNNVLRLSLHAYNTQDEAELLAGLITEL